MLGSGIEIDKRNPEVEPGDDLYHHMNGLWLDGAQIPEDKARYGAFTVVAEAAERAVRTILEDASSAEEGSEERKVGDLYRSFLNEDRILEKGQLPLLNVFESIDEACIKGKLALASELGSLERSGAAGLWQLFVDNDPGDPEKYSIFVEQAGLGLPDESYYHDQQFEQIREAYRAHLRLAFDLVGLENAERRAEHLFGLETRIAKTHWDNVRSRNVEETYNPMNLGQLQNLMKGFPLSEWLGSIGVSEAQLGTVVVRQPSFIKDVCVIWSSEESQHLRDWMLWNALRAFSPFLTPDLEQSHFNFYGRELSGIPKIRPRWKRAVSVVENVMGEAVGKLYVDKHFPAESKLQIDSLVGTLLEAYRESISGLAWMSEETKARALDKLSKFNPKIGYPSKWRDYSGLEVNSSELWDNVVCGNKFLFEREIAKIGSPIDRDEWFMTPQTVNAYYNPGLNEIVFPAAILQYPFFDPNRDPASNYGAIGAVIGHEIGHGFDDQGSRYDGDGRLNNWWTDQDRLAFESRTAELISQFDGLSPRGMPGYAVNGSLTLGENIGDLGGLSIAWKAYKLSLGEEDPPEIDGLSASQRFFLSWAQSWKLAVRFEEAQKLLKIDPHAPPEFRCNQIVRNLDAFYDAFEVSPSNKLWLDPDKRVEIW